MIVCYNRTIINDKLKRCGINIKKNFFIKSKKLNLLLIKFINN